MDSNTIEDLVTQIVTDDGVDYEEAVERLRLSIDALYGPRPMKRVDELFGKEADPL